MVEYNPGGSTPTVDGRSARPKWPRLGIPSDGWGLGKLQIEIFEKTVEHR